MSDPPKDIHRRREASPLVAVLAPKPRPPPLPWKPQPSHTASTPQALLGRSLLLRLQSDEKLVTLTRRGHPGAFDALVHRYYARLHAFCRHMLGSNEDAEDVLQEVFVSAYNGRSSPTTARSTRGRGSTASPATGRSTTCAALSTPARTP